MSNIDPIKLLIVIVDRGLGEKVVELNQEFGVGFQTISFGKGTADSTIMQYLGLDEIKKDVVISTVLEDKVQEVLYNLVNQMHFNEPGKGIAFTIPINCVSGISTLNILKGLEE